MTPKKPVVSDVIDNPELKRAVAEIDRRADEQEFAYRARRGMAIPRTLWRRMANRRSL